MTKKTGLDEYLDQVSQYLTGPASEKKAALEKVRLFLADTPGIEDMSLSELLKIVDPPEEVAEQFMEGVKTKKVAGNMRNKMTARILLVVLVSVAVLLLGIYVFDHFSYVRGYEGDKLISSGLYDPETNADSGIIIL